MSPIAKTLNTNTIRYTATKTQPQTFVKVNCGCGFRTDNLTEAESHAVSTGHVLTIAGIIKHN